MALSLSPVRTDKDTAYPKHIKKAAVGLAIIEKYKEEFVDEFDASEEDVEKWLEHCLQTYEVHKQELDAKARSVLDGKSINSNRNGPSVPVVDKMKATLTVFMQDLAGELDRDGHDVLTGPVLKKAVLAELQSQKAFADAELSPSWYTYQLAEAVDGKKSAKWISTGANIVKNNKPTTTKKILIPESASAMREWVRQSSEEQKEVFKKDVEALLQEVEAACK